MRFKYIGRDGSCGFKKGKIYTIQSSIWNNELLVVATDKETDEILFCPYSNLESFFRNWEVEG